MEGVEPTHSHEYQILSLARLPIPPHRPENQQLTNETSVAVTFASRICIPRPPSHEEYAISMFTEYAFAS